MKQMVTYFPIEVRQDFVSDDMSDICPLIQTTFFFPHEETNSWPISFFLDNHLIQLRVTNCIIFIILCECVREVSTCMLCDCTAIKSVVKWLTCIV